MAKRLKKKVKKKVETFWKKRPELKSVADHVGKLIDRIDPSKIPDLMLSALCFYAGARTAQRFHATAEGTLIGGGIGILGYKLATTPGGGVINSSQLAGLGILGSIGLVGLTAVFEATIDESARATEFAFSQLPQKTLEEQLAEAARERKFYVPVRR